MKYITDQDVKQGVCLFLARVLGPRSRAAREGQRPGGRAAEGVGNRMQRPLDDKSPGRADVLYLGAFFFPAFFFATAIFASFAFSLSGKNLVCIAFSRSSQVSEGSSEGQSDGIPFMVRRDRREKQ
jgi:hypothetical protein